MVFIMGSLFMHLQIDYCYEGRIRQIHIKESLSVQNERDQTEKRREKERLKYAHESAQDKRMTNNVAMTTARRKARATSGIMKRKLFTIPMQSFSYTSNMHINALRRYSITDISDVYLDSVVSIS